MSKIKGAVISDETFHSIPYPKAVDLPPALLKMPGPISSWYRAIRKKAEAKEPGGAGQDPKG